MEIFSSSLISTIVLMLFIFPALVFKKDKVIIFGALLYFLSQALYLYLNNDEAVSLVLMKSLIITLLNVAVGYFIVNICQRNFKM